MPSTPARKKILLWVLAFNGLWIANYSATNLRHFKSAKCHSFQQKALQKNHFCFKFKNQTTKISQQYSKNSLKPILKESLTEKKQGTKTSTTMSPSSWTKENRIAIKKSPHSRAPLNIHLSPWQLISTLLTPSLFLILSLLCHFPPSFNLSCREMVMLHTQENISTMKVDICRMKMEKLSRRDRQSRGKTLMISFRVNSFPFRLLPLWLLFICSTNHSYPIHRTSIFCIHKLILWTDR